MSDSIVAHVVSERAQRFALEELSFATVRLHDQSAVVSRVATEVAAGDLSPSLVSRLDEVSSYMSRLVAEREQYAGGDQRPTAAIVDLRQHHAEDKEDQRGNKER